MLYHIIYNYIIRQHDMVFLSVAGNYAYSMYCIGEGRYMK